MRYRLPIQLILFASILFLLWNPQNSSTDPIVYRCPPCGCSHDKHIHTEPGKCQMCNMPLYQYNEAYEPLNSFVGPMLIDDLTRLHSKFIYPGFIIGMILGIFSLMKLKGKSFNPFLGGLLLVLALYGFKNQLFGVDHGFHGDYRMLFVPISFILTIGPLSYLYIQSLTNKFEWKRSYLLHFLPASIVFIIYTVLLFSPTVVKREFMLTPFELMFAHIEQLLVIISLTVYLYISIRVIVGLKSLEKKERYKYSLANKFYIMMAVLLGVWTFLILLNFKVYDMGVATLTYNPLWVVMSMIIYWMLIEVLLNPKQFFSYSFGSSSNGFPIEQVEAYKSQLLHIMKDQRAYLDPALSLDKLAKQLEMNPKYLSLVINNGFNKNFYEFVNEYRIAEVKERLLDPSYSHLTIAAIANEAGFNSKSSFNSIFKKHTNSTPKEFLKQNQTS